jgi:hypothetical protein
MSSAKTIPALDSSHDDEFATALVEANLPGQRGGGYVLPKGYPRKWVASLLECLVVSDYRLGLYIDSVAEAASKHGLEVVERRQHVIGELHKYFAADDPDRTCPSWTDEPGLTDDDLAIIGGQGFRSIRSDARLAEFAVHLVRLTHLGQVLSFDPQWQARRGQWFDDLQAVVLQPEDGE